MFNSFFTTYQAVEPPPIVSPEVQAVESDFSKFAFNPVGNLTELPEEVIQIDPLKTQAEAPIIFDAYKAPDKVDSKTTLTNPSISFSDQKVNVPSQRAITKFKDKADYANTMYQYLYKALQDNGIDAATWAPTLVAHTSIESGWGNRFSRENNNFGGIKGKGSKVVNTKEWSPSKGYYTIKDTFKSYPSVQAFADDYVKKLKNKFKAFEGTPQDYLKNIRKHGYFTASLSDYQRMLSGRLDNVNKLLNN